MRDPLARPSLRLPEMLRALADHHVEWVLSGSTVLAVYGAPLSPNDLDVVPALDPANLRRVAALLTSLDAVPAHIPDSKQGLSVPQCQQWRPDPPTADQFDHLFVTRLGKLDIPPRLTGPTTSCGRRRPGWNWPECRYGSVRFGPDRTAVRSVCWIHSLR